MAAQVQNLQTTLWILLRLYNLVIHNFYTKMSCYINNFFVSAKAHFLIDYQVITTLYSLSL